MYKVFIDTNVLLSFFAFTSDDLAQLEKVVVELKAGNLQLLITDQVQDEFRRNRENKIADALKGFPEKAGIGAIPQMVKHHVEFVELQAAADNYIKLKATIIKKLEEEIKKRTLPADKVIAEILSNTQIIESSNEVIAAAQLRMSIGKPPGKQGSLGDAINWELLLRSCDSGSDLFVVTRDRDFLSPVSDDRFNEYLADEWRERCGGEVYLFPNIRELFKKIAPSIQLSVAANTANLSLTTHAPAVAVTNEVAEVAEELVRALENSRSYQQTHRAIRRMPRSTDLTKDQITRLFRAAVENQEIFSINEDEDVDEFFRNLYKSHPEQLENGVRKAFLDMFG